MYMYMYKQLTEGYDAVVADYGFSRHVSDVSSSAKTQSDVGPIKYTTIIIITITIITIIAITIDQSYYIIIIPLIDMIMTKIIIITPIRFVYYDCSPSY